MRVASLLFVAAIAFGCGAPHVEGRDAGATDAGAIDASVAQDAYPLDTAVTQDSAAVDAWVAADGAPEDANAGDSGATSDAGDSGATSDAGACVEACGQLSACGLSCTTYGIDCATSTPEDDCLWNCVATIPCIDLSQQTIGACQAMCAPDAGAPDAGSSGPACQSCMAMTMGCAGPLFACGQDTHCVAWLTCLGGATSAEEARACDEAHPSSGPRPDVYSCMCGACAVECAIFDPCSA